MLWTCDVNARDNTCPDCHRKGTMQLLIKSGIPVRWCPFYGYYEEDNSWYKEITTPVAKEIIHSGEPRGLFIVTDDARIVGIDNTTGETWTEEFQNRSDCLRWLLQEGAEDARCLVESRKESILHVDYRAYRCSPVEGTI